MFGMSAKSTLISFQGAAGSDICKGSLLHSGVAIRQALHDFTLLSTSLSMFGNQTFSRNSDLVFTNPWWSSCARLNTWCCRLFGTTMRVPRRIRLPDTLTVISSFILSRRRNSTASCLQGFGSRGGCEVADVLLCDFLLPAPFSPMLSWVTR